ncbi:potassium transporter Kup [Hansschlegelia zhihuaiae]|uniref:Probable potassium transport system protein Kup n=1 Tax=Hansschlegelia zhihuaiae TaxID=405005 RepID=A0A4V1KJP9_9HYPH|nr:potassium transporter Kup [Hansschlegelia zhihuaiae]RXF74952.1 potassium transporter Kup [Hansschlegelia zhihuaiae]
MTTDSDRGVAIEPAPSAPPRGGGRVGASGTHGASAAQAAEVHDERHGFWTLTIGSVGVVYGDIGTSPLYAMRESLLHLGHRASLEEVIGITSLLIWALIVVVTYKYVMILLRADNHGEGGTLSLMALAQEAMGRATVPLTALGVVGAALFYGDAIITPAVSVLSAAEGLKVASPAFAPYVLPMTLLIIVALYAMQSFGTGRVAAFFGPITVVWFLTLAALGAVHIMDAPAVLAALNPWHALLFLIEHKFLGFVVLGATFLAVTGAEALYADMGHFGPGPIRTAWLGLVLPSLMINYLGQAALAVSHPEAIENLFFLMAPEWGRLPLVLLACVATVIASQAVISGAYSLTRQAMQLGLLPHLEVQHTSETQHGQIYMPKVNWLMLAGVLLLVLTFQTSSRLAAAYGIAVTGTMIMTSLLATVVIAKSWKLGWPVALGMMVPILIVDVTFLSANMLKIKDGGYIPLMLGAAMVVLMWTWIRGVRFVEGRIRREAIPLKEFAKSMSTSSATRVKGTAMYLTSSPEITPPALLHNLKHNKVLHERNVILTVHTTNQPTIRDSERISLNRVSEDFATLEVLYGFMEDPNLPRALAQAKELGLPFDMMKTSFFVGRRSFRASASVGMPLWQDHLFIGLVRQSYDATEYFRIPAGRVVELGNQMVV